MDLENLFEVIVHYILIRGMTYLGHQHKVRVVSELVCIVIYWTKHLLSHDICYPVVMTLQSYYTT